MEDDPISKKSGLGHGDPEDSDHLPSSDEQKLFVAQDIPGFSEMQDRLNILLSGVEDPRIRIRTAIRFYENEGLPCFPKETMPYARAIVLTFIGSLNMQLVKLQDVSDNYLGRAVDVLEKALNIPELQSTTSKYGTLYYPTALGNLGIAYTGLAALSQDKVGLLHKAIEVFAELSLLYPVDKFPVDYALSIYNKANAYAALSRVENRDENMIYAITLCALALRILEKNKDPRAQIMQKELERLKAMHVIK